MPRIVWNPMDTAPKDGRWLLLKDTSRGEIDLGCWNRDEKTGLFGWCFPEIKLLIETCGYAGWVYPWGVSESGYKDTP